MVTPRPYQLEAISKSRSALRERRRALVVLPTGLGKTLVSAWTWKDFEEGRGLFLVHTNGILYDAIREYRKVFGESARFTIFNSRKSFEGAEVVFATFQAMRGNLKRFRRDEFAWMTVDETHHAQAASYRPVVEYFDCPRLGITATPNRADLLDIREIFGPEVINLSLEEAIARGWLPRIEYHLVTDPGFDDVVLKRIAREVFEEGRRLSLKELNRRIFVRARDEKVAEIIERHDETSLVFCRNIGHAEHFRGFLKDAETYHSHHSLTKNQGVLERLRLGITRRVLAVDAFNEGINVPDVGLVVFYRTTESETIWRQQLGRGLRPTKGKLTVLDFVGNIARIQRLREIANKVAEYHESSTSEEERAREKYERTPLHLSGKGFDFTFADAIVDLGKVLERVQVSFYPTWEEAAEAARKLGIQSSSEYRNRCKEDPRLPINPYAFYSGFPGFGSFLGTNRRYAKDPYPTWEEAAEAARKLGVQSCDDYHERYKRDLRLLSNPNTDYSDFPGWPKFLGTDFYPTWEEAAEAARGLGIQSDREYKRRYREDPRLPSCPAEIYPNFPGLKKFLGTDFYHTWEEAAEAASKLGVRSGAKYKKRCKEDLRLPSNPRRVYPDFPGWRKFLGTDFYPTWEEAAEAARGLGIQSDREYKRRYREDSRLPSCLKITYPNFPGLEKFLGTDFYPTWEEAAEAARKLGVRSGGEYRKHYKKDARLPSNPNKSYPAFPGWKKFLGKE